MVPTDLKRQQRCQPIPKTNQRLNRWALFRPQGGGYFEFCSGLFSIPAAIRHLPGVVILSLPAISAM
jgi:hypothetical protein